MRIRRAVVLLSGGLDSATCLYWAKSRGYRLHALTARYGQRHGREIASAKRLARAAGAELHASRLSLPWLKASSLVDVGKALPDIPLKLIGQGGIPSTYVPGRNAVLVSLGISLADAVGAEAVIVGANSLDCSGYPDCRPEFYKALQDAATRGTRRGAEGKPLRILTPLIRMDKAGIVRLAVKLKVPIEWTWSCYEGGRRPCGGCDSCKLRAKGFSEAGRKDPVS